MAALVPAGSQVTTWLPAGTKAAIGGGMPVDVVSAATPLAYLKTGDLEGLKQIASVGDMFLGKVGGSMGEVSALMLLIGGLYLIWRKVINWQTPVAYIATVAVLTVLFPKAGRRWSVCFTASSAAACSWALSSWLPTMPPPPSPRRAS